MIQKINFNTTFKKQATKQNTPVSPPPRDFQPNTGARLSTDLLHSYFVGFGQSKKNTKSLSKTSSKNSPNKSIQIDTPQIEQKNANIMDTQDKLNLIANNLAQSGEVFLSDIINLAATYGNEEINQIHALRVALSYINDYIESLNSGEIMYGEASDFNLQYVLEDKISPRVLDDKTRRNKIKPIIEKEIKLLDKVLAESSQQQQNSAKQVTPIASKGLINDIFSEYIIENDEEEGGDGQVHDSTIFKAILKPNNSTISRSIIKPFITDMLNAINIDSRPLNRRVRLSFYDEKAQNIWKNLAVGTNIAVIHDKGTSPDYLINSFLHLFAENPKGYGRLNKENTKITVVNEDADLLYMQELIREKAKDPKTNQIIVFDMDKTVLNTLDAQTRMQLQEGMPLGLTSESAKMFLGASPNIKYVIISDKDSYYAQTNTSAKTSIFSDFGDVSVPLMNMVEAKKMFKEQPALTNKIKKQFTPNAIEKCIEASNMIEGNYPEKAQKIMDKIAAYYIDKKKEINLTDVQNYIKEAKDVFKASENDDSIKIVFDTGVKLKDMVGTPATKQEARSIVQRIKDKSIGTKGFIIYSLDGSIGSGRKYTAKAIAGEAKVPYVEINAVDFGTKEVNLFGNGNLSPEGSIKKLFDIVKAQADTNVNKGAVLFIENFEYFSAGENLADNMQISQYYRKSMSQLIREMIKAQDQGFNIIVAGSTTNPDLVGDTTTKSFKFIDKIAVESPAYNPKAREEIIEYYIKQKGIKLAGDEAEHKKIKNHINLLTERSAYIEILTLLDKAKNVAKERKHKTIDKADFTEAYLQQTTGRPASEQEPEYRKKLVTSHECGHALNGIIMEELARKQNRPDHIGDSVNFITLDPRGMFGGAVFYSADTNPEKSFETTFANLVNGFGGNSCEKHFYGEDGSWGINCDMKQNTYLASIATGLMGQGKYFGKKSIDGMLIMSEKDKDNFNKDIDVMLTNSQLVSDAITQVYEDFNKEFVKKYFSKVGTGECIVQRDEFLDMLNKWREKQPPEKQKEFKLLDNTILEVIAATKRGVKCHKAGE